MGFNGSGLHTFSGTEGLNHFVAPYPNLNPDGPVLVGINRNGTDLGGGLQESEVQITSRPETYNFNPVRCFWHLEQLSVFYIPSKGCWLFLSHFFFSFRIWDYDVRFEIFDIMILKIFPPSTKLQIVDQLVHNPGWETCPSMTWEIRLDRELCHRITQNTFMSCQSTLRNLKNSHCSKKPVLSTACWEKKFCIYTLRDFCFTFV